MADIFGQYRNVSENNRNKSFDDITACEEHYMKLLKKYTPEIKEIEEMMRDLRNERMIFYLETLPRVRITMNNDDVLSAENKADWLDRLQQNMEKSFAVSEKLIEHYVTKNLEEFKRELDSLTYGGKQ